MEIQAHGRISSFRLFFSWHESVRFVCTKINFFMGYHSFCSMKRQCDFEISLKWRRNFFKTRSCKALSNITLEFQYECRGHPDFFRSKVFHVFCRTAHVKNLEGTSRAALKVWIFKKVATLIRLTVARLGQWAWRLCKLYWCTDRKG